MLSKLGVALGQSLVRVGVRVRVRVRVGVRIRVRIRVRVRVRVKARGRGRGRGRGSGVGGLRTGSGAVAVGRRRHRRRGAARMLLPHQIEHAPATHTRIGLQAAGWIHSECVCELAHPSLIRGTRVYAH